MGSRIVEKEFVFIRAVAVFRNRFILPPGFICCALASHPYSEIMRRLFNVKLEAHIQPFLAPRLTYLKSIILLVAEMRNRASRASQEAPGFSYSTCRDRRSTARSRARARRLYAGASVPRRPHGSNARRKAAFFFSPRRDS